MIIAFLGILLLSPVLSFVIYKHQGKKQLVKLDLVQFIYLFVMAPVLFVWVKSFLFYILKGELGIGLSVNEVFIVDTVFSVIAFYIFSAVAIHTLTKTFRLHKDHNPLFDLFELSEYFHLWWSHLIIWIGLMVVLSFLSIVNLIVPIAPTQAMLPAAWASGIGIVLGIALFMIVWQSDVRQANYMRILKLSFAFFFALHVLLYFVVTPKFSAQYAAYWGSLNLFFAAVLSGLLLQRSRRAQSLRDRFTHFNWGNNIQLFEKK